MVYLNIVKSIRILLEALEGNDGPLGDPVRRSDAGDLWLHQLANLKLRLSPLVGLEASLATRLSGGGGISVSGGKGGVFVRRGWQTSVQSSPATPPNPRGPAARKNATGTVFGPLDATDDPTARMLDASKVGGRVVLDAPCTDAPAWHKG